MTIFEVDVFQFFDDKKKYKADFINEIKEHFDLYSDETISIEYVDFEGYRYKFNATKNNYEVICDELFELFNFILKNSNIEGLHHPLVK